MKPITKISRFYAQKVMPYIGGIRGSHLIYRILSDFAIKLERQEFLNVNNIEIHQESLELDRDTNRLLFNGIYEREECNLIKKHLAANFDVIELGGGIGYISCVINSELDDSKHIVAEPNPDLIPVIEKNRKLNDAEFKIMEKAYSASEGTLNLNLDDKFCSSTTYGHKEGSGLKVKGISLEKIIEESSIDKFTLVADIEGGEYDLIENEFHLIADKCPLAIIEFHDIENEELNSYIEKMRKFFDEIEKDGSVIVFVNKAMDVNHDL